MFLAFSSFVLIAGVRYKIGGDTLTYMEWYEQGIPLLNEMSLFNMSNANDTHFDYLWVAFCTFCGLFSDDYFFMQFVHALIINTVYFYFIYKNTKYRFTALLLYFSMGFLYFNTEIMRESLAIAVFLLSLPSFYKKKWIRYYLFAVVAFLFHTSAMLIFFFPFFRFIRINKFFIYSILIIIPLTGIIWSFFQEYIQLFFIFSNIESKVTSYFDEKYAPNLNGIILMMIIYVILPLILVLLSKKDKKIKEAPFIWLYIVLGIFTIYNGTVFTRFQNYMFFPFIIWLSNVPFDARNILKPAKARLIILLIFLFFAGRHYNYFKEDYMGVYFYERYFPYNSIVTKKEHPFR